MKRLRPVDLLLAGYNLVLACVWMSLLGRAPQATGLVVVHLAAAALPWGLARLPASPPRWLGILRQAYPWAGFVLFWSELGVLQAVRQAPTHDAFVAALDLRLFGAHLHQVWLPAAPAAWFQELMFGSYLSYYLLVFGPVLVAGLAGRGRMFRNMTFRLLVSYLGCDLLYVLFPVYGPRFGADPAAGQFLDGFFRSVSESLRAAGDSPGTAFPSSHVAGVFTAAFLGFRWFPRPVAWVWTAGALAVAASTVYTGNHFLVDVVAGGLVALVLQAAVSRLAAGGAGNPLRPVFPCVLPSRIAAQVAPRVLARREGGGS